MNLQRFNALWRFNYPLVERQVIIYLIVSVFFAILMLLPVSGPIQFSIYTFGNMALNYLVVLAPIVLAKNGDYRIIERLIPATAGEKFCWRLIYFLIVIPAVTIVFPYWAGYLYLQIPSIQTEAMKSAIEMAENLPFRVMLLNKLTYVAEVLTCLYVVSYTRKSRIVKSVLAVFVVQFVVACFGFAWGIYSTTAALSADSHSPLNPQQLQDEVLARMYDTSYLFIVIGVVTVYTSIMLILNYRVLKHRNL